MHCIYNVSPFPDIVNQIEKRIGADAEWTITILVGNIQIRVAEIFASFGRSIYQRFKQIAQIFLNLRTYVEMKIPEKGRFPMQQT